MATRQKPATATGAARPAGVGLLGGAGVAAGVGADDVGTRHVGGPCLQSPKSCSSGGGGTAVSESRGARRRRGGGVAAVAAAVVVVAAALYLRERTCKLVCRVIRIEALEDAAFIVLEGQRGYDPG
jgi:hypothetical protein